MNNKDDEKVEATNEADALRDLPPSDSQADETKAGERSRSAPSVSEIVMTKHTDGG